MDEFKEYATFTVTASDGSTVELAVVDEFEFEKKSYVAAARIEGDTVLDDQVFIYRVKLHEEDFEVEKIESMTEYERIAKAYLDS